MNKLALEVKQIFIEKYAAIPKIYFSPGRINLIGEHIDYNDGYVMPAAIDKGIYYAVAKNSSSDIHFYALDFNEDFSININDITRLAGWKNYVLGVVNEFILLGKIMQGFNCVFAGDIPLGAGMSSSAAVEGGLAFALNDIFDFGLNTTELALLCQRAEHTYPQVNCGIMDMYANLHGKKDHVLLLDCKNNTHQYFPLQLTGYKIVLINSKVHHSLADGAYNIRRQRCEEGLELLQKQMQIQTWRDITNAELIEPYKIMMKPEVYDCCKYVVQEIERTKMAALLLQQNNLAGFGKLMFETHEGLSKLYKVSCSELDFLVDEAAKNNQVSGARLMGGGFGGCSINIVKEDAVNHFIAEITTAYTNQFNIEPEAYVILTAEGTGCFEI
jgi:galactokinase